MRLTAVRLWCKLFIIVLWSQGIVAGELVKTPSLSDENGKYSFNLLKLALSYSNTQYEVQEGSDPTKTFARVIEDLKANDIDVIWTTSDKDREAEFLPIRIPLYKGMFGYRIFIIKKGNQVKFDSVRTLEDLKKISMGQGRNWADTKVLEENGLRVVKVNKYPSLFYMIDGDRMDAFPRGIHEPWDELDAHKDLDLAIENNILLVYKIPFYFFVAKGNTKLAAQIEAGLNKAIADGSFDKLFYANPGVQKVLKSANLKNRRIINLTNSTLPVETPVDRAELWLDISKF
jgi:Bacterial extracellular solute-binding proteins, family 3